MKYYYARVSTKEQNLDRQLDAAERLGAEKVYADKASGKNLSREEYQKMKKALKPGDEVYFHELSRLGRNFTDIRNEIQWFDEHGVRWHSEDIPTTMVDFQGQEWVLKMINDLMITVFGNLAEQERLMMLQRQREGIDAMPVVNGKKWSKKTGKYMGRPEKEISDFAEIFQRQKMGEFSVLEGCEMLGISRATWFNKARKVV